MAVQIIAGRSILLPRVFLFMIAKTHIIIAGRRKKKPRKMVVLKAPKITAKSAKMFAFSRSTVYIVTGIGCTEGADVSALS